MTPDVSNGSTVLSPITRAIRDVGLPAVVIIFLLIVLTGLLPTPLMSALEFIEDVSANQENIETIAGQQLKVAIATCELLAKDKTEASKCNPLGN